MKSKWRLFTSIVFIALFFLINSEIKYYLGLPQTWPHEYCSDNGNFHTFEKAKGHDTFGSVIIGFNQYKVESNQPNLILYRRFHRKWWQIWNWVEFAFAPYWSCPYAERCKEN